MNQIGTLATGIFVNEFLGDTDTRSVLQISGWLQNNLGLLNTRIFSSYSGEDPNMNLEAQAILKEMYLQNYYTNESRRALMGASSTFVMIKNADTTYEKANYKEVAKTWNDLAKEASANITRLCSAYVAEEAEPVGVGGWDALYSGSNVYSLFPNRTYGRWH